MQQEPTSAPRHGNSFIPLACAGCDDFLPFSVAFSIPLCYVLFPATPLHQLFIHPLSPDLAICFLVYLPILLFPNSYIILFWEFYFLPFSVHTQTNIIYLNYHMYSEFSKFLAYNFITLKVLKILVGYS